MSTDPPLSDILSKLDAAVDNCHVLHRADIKQLGGFCHSVVDEVNKFLAIVGNLGLPHHPKIDKAKIGVHLGECLRYIRDRSTAEVCAYVVRAARSASEQRDYYVVSISDLKSKARTTICDRVIKPALVACERSLCTAGTPLDHRSFAAQALTVLFAVQDMDTALCFGHAIMNEFEQRVKNETKLEELIKRVGHLMDARNVLHDKVDNVAEAVGSLVIENEAGRCPTVFFMVPHAGSKPSWLRRKKESFTNVFRKKMDLHFVCSMFFYDLSNAVSSGKHQTAQTKHKPEESHREISSAICVNIPRGFVTRWMPVIKLTVKIVDLIVHAAALSLGVGALIPGLSLPEQMELLVVLKEDFGTFELETESIVLPEGRSDSGGVVVEGAKMGLLDGSAREVMQTYLDEHHKTTWEAEVLKALKIETNKKRTKCAYICKHNPKHLEAWQDRI